MSTPVQGRLLPLPVVFALLRLLRHHAPKLSDEDVLFHEFNVVDEQLLLNAAAGRLLGNGHRAGRGMTEATWRAKLDAVLVDMVREAHREREDAKCVG